MTETRTFETKVCGRCCGTGRFSYNQIDGDRCYGCQGAGKVYTARGQAAVEFLRASRRTKMSDLKIGQRVNIPGYGKFTLTRSEACPPGSAKSLKNGVYVDVPMWEIAGKTMGYSATPDFAVEVIAPTVAERNAQIIAALDYQDTLTETGKPRKIK